MSGLTIDLDLTLQLGAGGPTSYAWIGSNLSSSGNTNSFSVSPGAHSTDTRVVVGLWLNNGNSIGATITSVVVAGVTLNQDVLVSPDAAQLNAFYSGTVSGGLGSSPTVTVTMTGMQFQYSAVSVWSWPSGKSFNSSSNFAHGAGTFTDNISVDANDFVFGMSYVVGGASTITFEGGCTQQPTGNRNPDATDVNYFDWLIAATNASFAIQIGGTNSYQYLLANYR